MNQIAAEATLRPLAGRLACVTGAGRGLGAGIAAALADAGAEVVLLSRTIADLENVARNIREKGGSARPIACDVCSSSEVRSVFASMGTLDILVNNAGANVPAAFVDVTEADLDKVMNLNVRAAFLVAQAAAINMLQRPKEERMPGGPSIVHITSQMGRVGAPRRTVYCMTKHAVEGLAKAMAVELAPQGIRVNCVAPTFIETEMTAPFFRNDPQFAEWVLDRIPMGRLGAIEEVARSTVFLASPAASMITGQSLAVDGGWTAQ